MGIENNPNKNISWFQMGAFPIERVEIYIKAAQELEIPYEIIPNDDERVRDPFKLMKAGANEQIIKVDYGDHHKEYWEKVSELSPLPPPKPTRPSPEIVLVRSSS